jgi:hypothetical protein
MTKVIPKDNIATAGTCLKTFLMFVNVRNRSLRKPNMVIIIKKPIVSIRILEDKILRIILDFSEFFFNLLPPKILKLKNQVEKLFKFKIKVLLQFL